MLKKIVAILLIVVAGGAWGYLDYLNKQEQQIAEQARKEMETLRAQAQMRAEAQAKLLAQLSTDLEACKASAEMAKNEFLARNQQPVKRKPGQFTIPQAAQDEASAMLEQANAACQSTHDSRLAAGQ